MAKRENLVDGSARGVESLIVGRPTGSPRSLGTAPELLERETCVRDQP